LWAKFTEDVGVKKLLFGAVAALAMAFAVGGASAASAASMPANNQTTGTQSSGSCLNLANGYVSHNYFPYGYANGIGGSIGYGYPIPNYNIYSCGTDYYYFSPNGPALWNGESGSMNFGGPNTSGN
jgi:hypothetical protein